MFKTLKSWLAAKTPHAARTPHRFAPQVEALQDRITPTVTVSGGNLSISGTPYADTVSVSVDRWGILFEVKESNSQTPFQKTTRVPVVNVTGIITFQGGDGDDTFDNITSRASFAEGGNGNDTLRGGLAQVRNEFHGQAGNDVLYGGRGSDYLYGGDGNDWCFAGLDDVAYNLLDGGNGHDELYGSGGGDDLRGGGGDDYLSGAGGDDFLYGQSGRDALYGGVGSDRLDGGEGDGKADYLNGGAGADQFVFNAAFIYTPYFMMYNRDAAVDFNPNEDGYV